MGPRLALPIGLVVAASLACSALTGSQPTAGAPQPAISPTWSAFETPALSVTATPTPRPPLPWEPAGFGGAGNFLGVYFDPKQPGVAYAASDVAGVFRSADFGDGWEMRSAGLGNYEVSSFAVDPFDSNTLYAGVGGLAESSKAGIYISHDAGLTWEPLPNSASSGITFRKYRTADAIAPDPAQAGVLLSGSRENGLWRTTDGGGTWAQVVAASETSAPFYNDGTIEDDLALDPHPAPVSAVRFDPANPGVVYAGLDGAGAIKSEAGGVAGSWQAINGGMPDEATVKDFAVGTDQTLYAALGTAGVYKSADGGNSWQAVNGGLPELGDSAWVSSVAVHPADSGVAYLTLVTHDDPSVWKTTDGGKSWEPKGDVAYDPGHDPTETWAASPTLSWQVALDPSNPNRVFFVSHWGIYRSDDGGEHWAAKIVGAQNTCVTDLVMETDGTLFATHTDAGLLKSADRGATWSAVLPSEETGFDPALTGHYWNIAVAQAGQAKTYYLTADTRSGAGREAESPEEEAATLLGFESAGYSQVLRSDDGIHWTTVFSTTLSAGWIGGGLLGLAVDPRQPSTIYVAQDGGQVFESDDGGDTWAPTGGQPDDNSFTYALAVDEAGTVLAGTLLGGLWRSTDGGASWQGVLPNLGSVFHLLAVPGAIYASGDDANLYRSLDGGEAWERLTEFASVDDGDGVGDMGGAIAVDPTDPDHILFSRMDTWHSADAGAGLAESRDGGHTWIALNAGLPHRNVSALAIASDGSLFAGSWCGGIWRLPPESSSP